MSPRCNRLLAVKTTISRAVGGLIPRRLSHARSPSIVDTVIDSGMVIGVSVEEATTENAPDDLPSCCGSVMVVHSLRNQPPSAHYLAKPP